ncbi:MAG: RT0821/Lpp0805 family surface protein [Deferrisomatales bacterium]
MRTVVAILAALALALGAVPPAGAKEKGDKHKVEHRKGGKVKVKYVGGGPPPWAPAHGYRRGGAGAETAAVVPYAAPFQLDVGRCNRGTLGTVLGGVAGGVLGSRVGDGTGRTAAIIGGTILGAIVGDTVGRWMDQLDQACVGQVLEHTPTGKTVEWSNPDNGSVYQVTPTDTYQARDDRYCREYQTTAQIGGRTERAYGTACRQPDGSWQLAGR